jgi:hypothetical protein
MLPLFVCGHEDDDAHVYAEDFHVMLGEGSHQGFSVPVHGQQGTRIA